MNQVDGFVAAVPTASRDKHLQHAERAAAIFREFGALTIVECWGDDVPEGKLTSFTMAGKREPGETVVSSWITWASRPVRDEGWQKVTSDPRMADMQMPFDGKRMIYGGFQMILQQ